MENQTKVIELSESVPSGIPPKIDVLDKKSILIGLAIAVLFGTVSTSITHGEILFLESVVSGVTLFVISCILFFVFRGIFRFIKQPIAKSGTLGLFFTLIIMCGIFLVIGARHNRREASQRDFLRPSQFAIPVAVQPGMAEELNGSLYRSNKWLFRIRFPEGWEIQNGDGSHIVKKANLPKQGNVSVLVREIPGAITGQIPVEDMLKYLDGMISPTLKMLNGQFIDKGMVKINNRDFAYAKMRVVYENLNGKVPAINNVYFTVEHGHIFLITTSVNESVQEKYSGILKSSANSFVIEDFDEKARQAGYQI